MHIFLERSVARAPCVAGPVGRLKQQALHIRAGKEDFQPSKQVHVNLAVGLNGRSAAFGVAGERRRRDIGLAGRKLGIRPRTLRVQTFVRDRLAVRRLSCTRRRPARDHETAGRRRMVAERMRSR
jgi:hypothetical protein